MEQKKCGHCLTEKPKENFHKNKNTSDGLSSYCKICKKKSDSKNYSLNKQKYNKTNKERYLKNKDKISSERKQRRKEDEEFLSKEKERSRKYREENKEKLKESKKKYYQDNKDRINQKTINKKKNNINLRLQQNLRSRIWHALKSGNKKENFQELIGCSVEELKKYLESKFSSGMSWDNYGTKWHVDHIKPCCLFDMTIKEQRLECFNYKNLQPLLAEENLSKNRFYKENE
jgi:hypothetical protein